MSPDRPPVLDGHNDTLLDLHLEARGGGRSFLERTSTGHVDLPRAREARYAGGLFAVFAPSEGGDEPEFVETAEGYRVPMADPVDPDRAREFTSAVLDRRDALLAEAGESVRLVEDPADLEGALADDALAMVTHLEGAAAVEPDRSNLEDLYERGVRSIGLTWSRPNAFGEGVPFRFPAAPDTGPGLTDAGRELVRACNDRGILLDLAHLNLAGFEEVADISTAPLVVSHAAVHAICPSTRNVTDAQLDAIADSGGVLGIAFAAENLRPDGERDLELPIARLVDHFEYVADRVGVEHVAFGTDFDGCSVPETVGDVTGLPAVLDELADRGFDEVDLAKIAHGNWRRVLSETWA